MYFSVVNADTFSATAEAAAYVETIYQWPAFRRWYQAALQEVQG